jgi:hypothetical protein
VAINGGHANEWADRSQAFGVRQDSSLVESRDVFGSNLSTSTVNLKKQGIQVANHGMRGVVDLRSDHSKETRAFGESRNREAAFSFVEMIWPAATEMPEGKSSAVSGDGYESESVWVTYSGAVYGLWVVAGVSMAVAVFEGVVQSRKRQARGCDVNELLLVGVHPELATFRGDGNPHVRILD